MDIRRVAPVQDGALTVHQRTAVAEDVPCRVYRSGSHGPRFQPTAAVTEGEDKLACDNSVDIQAGDELLIYRGKGVGAAVERTPPNDGGLRGVNTISGELAQHWATDSRVTPVQSGDTFVTTLENDRQYASYVNDGHRLDKHFVPGLYIDDSGLLSRDLSRDVGMVVGTKTTYVPGVYMKEAGVDKYEEVAETELRKLAGEVLR